MTIRQDIVNDCFEFGELMKNEILNNVNYELVQETDNNVVDGTKRVDLIFRNKVYDFYFGFNIYCNVNEFGTTNNKGTVWYTTISEFIPGTDSNDSPYIHKDYLTFTNNTTTFINSITTSDKSIINFFQDEHGYINLWSCAYLPYGSSEDYPYPVISVIKARSYLRSYFSSYEKNRFETRLINEDFINNANGAHDDGININIYFNPFVIQENTREEIGYVSGEIPNLFISGDANITQLTKTAFNEEPDVLYQSFIYNDYYQNARYFTVKIEE